MRDGVGEALRVLAGENEKVIVLDCDVGASTRAQKVASATPKQFINLGISEQATMGIAAGLALDGYIPIVALFAVFVERGYEVFRNSIALENLPALIIGTHAGVSVGEDGPTHQAIEDLPYFLALPGVAVFSPSSAELTKRTILHVVDAEELPAYVRVSRVDPRKDPGYTEYADYKCIMDNSSDIAIVSTGIATGEALIAEEILRKRGIPVDVYDVTKIKPLPDNLTRELSAYKAIVTAEDHSPTCGFGTTVAAALAERGWGGKLLRVGSNGFGKSGKPYDVLKKYGPSSKKIVDKVKELTNNK